jgi:signal transduction histidine kinase/ActR/RegA family two-component response regulator
VSDLNKTVLVCAPRGRDSVLAVQLIERHGLRARAVKGIDEVLEGVLEAGCAVITAEALGEEDRDRLAAALAAQPPWSDFPIVLFAPGGLDRADDALTAVKTLGNVSILERPVHSSALITALGAALRGRRRQFEAREAIVRRDQFLAMLGHELRNPLAAIMLAIETIPTGQGQGEIPFARQRAIIERQSRHLARLVDDLLDVARVTSGKVRLQLAPIDVTDVVERCLHGAELAARSQRIDLRADLWPQPIYIDGDLVRVEEIINNLIGNALKYSPQGARVIVRVRREQATCVIEVADSGIGMAPDMLARVFDLFVQADATLERSHGGLGIGLTLVRSLVQLHRGTITAHSDGLGHGSTFVVELPLSRSAPRREGTPTLVIVGSNARQRVLLVEDNADLLEMTRELLESENCEVMCAADGNEGLKHLLAWKPDLGFIDIGIPGIDGYEVAVEGRRRGSGAYLVAMTGYGQPDDRRRALEAGFDRHATKPVSAATLREALAVASSRRRKNNQSAR